MIKFVKSYPLVIILSIAAVLYLLGNNLIAITDPVESNYTLTAINMLEAGDYISPRIYGNYWFDKPIFFYWELLIAYKLFGITNFAARLFPALLSLVSLTLMYTFAKRVTTKTTAIISTTILASSLQYWLLAKTVITDTTLFLFFSATLVFYYLGYTQPNKRFYYGSYIFAALATLTKGPIGFLLPGLIIVLFLASQRNFKSVTEIKFFTGFPLFFVLASSWYIYMYSVHGQAFIDGFFGIHNMLRATVSEHPRTNVWYYYLGIFIITTIPWCFFLPKIIYNKIVALRKSKSLSIAESLSNPENTLTIFLLIWALTVNIFFQFMATKYTTYTFPALFPIALLFSKALANRKKLVTNIAIGMSVLYALLTFMVAAPLTTHKFSGNDVSLYLKTKASPNDIILYHGVYRASISHYSGLKIINVIGKDKISKFRPNGFNWSALNVEPILSFKELKVLQETEKGRFYFIIDTSKQTLEELKSSEGLTGNWILVNETENTKTYELIQ